MYFDDQLVKLFTLKNFKINNHQEQDMRETAFV